MKRFLKHLPGKVVKRIGGHLGLSAESMHSLDDMICNWLAEADDVHEETGTPSWENLMEALEHIGRKDIAIKIREGIVRILMLAG